MNLRFKILGFLFVFSLTNPVFGKEVLDYACGSVTKNIVNELSNWSVSTCLSELKMEVPKTNALAIFESFQFNQDKECIVECSKESDGWESCANRYKNYFVKEMNFSCPV